MSTDGIEWESIAEDALLLRFGRAIDPAVNARVHQAAHCIRRALPQLECIPAYASLTLRFDPLRWMEADARDPHESVQSAAVAAFAAKQDATSESCEHAIPVCYGGAFGPDLAAVAEHAALPPEQVIARHTAAAYSVAMLGFAPGFPYLLGLDPALEMPRRSDPRQRVPVGSVAIGGGQTGIYPAELPGGWRIIGRTPLRLFDLRADSPSVLAAGDRVTFHAIDEEAFRAVEAQGAE